MKELRTEFTGIGEVKGYLFKQIRKNDYAYIYEVLNPNESKPYYEVFERVENEQFDCVSYPKSKSFGVWAWCINDYDKALKKFNKVTKKAMNRALLK